MVVTDMKWTEIFKSIKCSRSIVDPNPGFKRQLNEFGKSEKLKAVGRLYLEMINVHIRTRSQYLGKKELLGRGFNLSK